jgi:hypothetical protein
MLARRLFLIFDHFKWSVFLHHAGRIAIDVASRDVGKEEGAGDIPFWLALAHTPRQRNQRAPDFRIGFLQRCVPFANVAQPESFRHVRR